MATVATTSLFTPLLILLLLESAPWIMADPPSSDDVPTPYNISPAVGTTCLVSVCSIFAFGFSFLAVRWIIKARWCRFWSGGPGHGGEEGPQRDPLPHGLTQEEASPTFLYKDVKMNRRVGDGELVCAVCLNEFEDHEALRRLPKCSHVFHPHCVDPWLVYQVTCPVCRAVLTPSKPNQSSSDQAEASGEHVLTIDDAAN